MHNREPMLNAPVSLRDADRVVGRIRNDGGWDRRYRIHREPIEPVRCRSDARGRRILVGVIVIGGLFVGILAWVAIASVAA